MPVNATQVFTRLHQYVQAHNAGQTTPAHRVRLGVLKTLETITHEYIREFRRVATLPEWADADRFPSVRFNNHRLANLCHCAERTIYNHLRLLEKAGLIRKVFHGWQQDYELWISEFFLLGEAVVVPPVVDLKSGSTPHFDLYRRQCLPPKITCETLETTKTNYNAAVDAVDNTPVRLSSLLPHQLCKIYTSESTLERETKHPTGDTSDTKDQAGGAGGPADYYRITTREGQTRTGSGNRVTPVSPASPALLPHQTGLEGYQRSLVRTFWDIAREKFWPGEFFSETHTNAILHLLHTDVFYNRFNGITTEKRSTDLYLLRLNQLEKAERWMHKTKWSGIMPPKCYFSWAFHKKLEANGQKGNFHYTTAWMLQDERRKQQQDRQKLLDTAIASVMHKRPPQGLKNGPAMSQIALYQYWRNRFTKLADSDLCDRFDAAIGDRVPRTISSANF